MDEDQLRNLSSDFMEMNNLLEKILQHQFGADNENLISAISQIENGFSKAVIAIAEEKGFEGKEGGGLITEDNIEEILRK